MINWKKMILQIAVLSKQTRRGFWTPALLLACLLVWGCGAKDGDPLARHGIPVSEGAAAGYVPDAVCGNCHAELAQSYSEVGMARSFYSPTADRKIEDFEAPPFFHPASERYYQIRSEENGLFFERYQLDETGQPIHRVEVEVDWILGSGHTSRTYLFQTQNGELYQLPLAWYTQSQSWGMAPGFDRADHLGMERLVRRECMFCHNAYPEVAEGSDAYEKPHLFPMELPEGIGCQRCHGPGAEHVRSALQGDRSQARESIVQPAKLGSERAVEICYGCHFQPSVTLPGVRRFGRATYSFRPGEPLDDYATQIDVDEARQDRQDRFEINHHPYRLEQSLCFSESEPGALSCVRCHDPHRKVPEQERKAHYRDACLSCHTVETCSLDAMAEASTWMGEVEVDDCASCHMPKRRTQDVVHVAMTDHRIARRPSGPERLAPLKEATPVLIDAELIHGAKDLPPMEKEVYRASAVSRAGGSPEATDFLFRALPQSGVLASEPTHDLVRGLLSMRRFEDVKIVATQALGIWPEIGRFYEWRGIARSRVGDIEGALVDFALALERESRPETWFNQGRILFGLKRFAEAEASFRRALDLRFNLPRAWSYLGSSLLELDRRDEAEVALRRALEIEPDNTRATLALSELLRAQGEFSEARRILEHGARYTRQPEQLQQALDQYRSDQ